MQQGATITSYRLPLRVRHPDIRVSEHRYILDVLLREQLGLEYQAEAVPGLNRVEIRCSSNTGVRKLRLGANLLIRPRSEWLTSASMPRLPLRTFDPQPVLQNWTLGPLPVLYPGISPVTTGAGKSSLSLPLDLLGGAFFLLTRYEELVNKERDRHNRFLASYSVAAKAGIVVRPLVDEYAVLLGRALEACFPGLRCRSSTTRIRLSHDIDHPFQFYGKTPLQSSVAIAKRLYRQRSPRAAWLLLKAARRAGLGGDITADPFNCYSELMAASEALGSPGEFYFMTGVTDRRYDEPYDLSRPELQQLLRTIEARGHIIGLHGSYHSFCSEEVLAQELGELLKSAQRAGIKLRSIGGRQHYLRWELPRTWRCWSNSGLTYDATVGFADRIGFRCGTAKEFQVFDLSKSRPLRLRERPLIAMDVTMTDYMHLSRASMAAALEELWTAVCRVGGTLEVLIHNCNPMARQLAAQLVNLYSQPLPTTK